MTAFDRTAKQITKFSRVLEMGPVPKLTLSVLEELTAAMKAQGFTDAARITFVEGRDQRGESVTSVSIVVRQS